MRRLALALLASSALGLALGQAATAADMPVKARPLPPPPVWSWTGFYVGAHLGAGWARQDFTTVNPFCLTDFIIDQFGRDGGDMVESARIISDGGGIDRFRGLGCVNSDRGSHNAIGVLGGLQVGYNWQIGWGLVGIEAQYSWANLKGDHLDSRSESHALFFGFSSDAHSRFSSEVKGIGTIAARFGLVSGPQDRTLWYVKVGAAHVKQDFNQTINFASTIYVPFAIGTTFDGEVSGSDSRWGWMVGTGLEFGLWDNWSAKVEYNYMRFKDKEVTLTGTGILRLGPLVSDPVSLSRTHSIDTDIHVIKFGINYRLDWGKAPVAVMAKY